MVLFALFLAAVVIVFLRLVFIPIVEGTERATENEGVQDTALETLRERFARGEIDEDEYECRRDVLTRE
ncbi:SHOCT domain-containing protein [Halosimplex aquaticum]